MPLTKKGRKLKGIFQREYGKKRGTSIFYSWEHNKHYKDGLLVKRIK